MNTARYRWLAAEASGSNPQRQASVSILSATVVWFIAHCQEFYEIRKYQSFQLNFCDFILNLDFLKIVVPGKDLFKFTMNKVYISCKTKDCDCFHSH